MQYLWGHKPLKVYGSRISESMLAVMCHILKGEPVISEKLGAAKPSTSKPVVDAAPTPVVAAPAPPAPQDPEINELHLQQVSLNNFIGKNVIKRVACTRVCVDCGKPERLWNFKISKFKPDRP